MSDLTLRQLLEEMRDFDHPDFCAAMDALETWNHILEKIRQAELSISFHGDAKAILQQILAEQT